MRFSIPLLKNIISPIAISIGGVLSMSLIAYLQQDGSFPTFVVSRHEIVNITFSLQAVILPISFLAIIMMHQYDHQSFKTFFRLSTRNDHSWNVYGPLIAGFFTLGTILLMAGAVTSQHGAINHSFYALVPWVLLFSLTNAWSEEIFSRFVIVAGLDKKIKPTTTCWISAIIFGLPHFFGTPSGFSGVIMSGFMGWVLAKSVIETKGIGWALLIHFLQDVVIFGAGAMIVAGND